MSEPAVVAASELAGRSGVAAGPARRWWILGVVGLAQLMVVLDATIVNIALPSAQRDLGFSNADRQWVVTAYSLAFGGLLLLRQAVSRLEARGFRVLVHSRVPCNDGGISLGQAVVAAARDRLD